MNISEVIFDEQALISISKSIEKYNIDSKSSIETALIKIMANSSEWNDDDFDSLVNVLNLCKKEIASAEDFGNTLRLRIDKKIVAIHELHNKKI